jgi:hypothetical protein
MARARQRDGSRVALPPIVTMPKWRRNRHLRRQGPLTLQDDEISVSSSTGSAPNEQFRSWDVNEEASSIHRIPGSLGCRKSEPQKLDQAHCQSYQDSAQGAEGGDDQYQSTSLQLPAALAVNKAPPPRNPQGNIDSGNRFNSTSPGSNMEVDCVVVPSPSSDTNSELLPYIGSHLPALNCRNGEPDTLHLELLSLATISKRSLGSDRIDAKGECRDSQDGMHIVVPTKQQAGMSTSSARTSASQIIYDGLDSSPPSLSEGESSDCPSIVQDIERRVIKVTYPYGYSNHDRPMGGKLSEDRFEEAQSKATGDLHFIQDARSSIYPYRQSH